MSLGAAAQLLMLAACAAILAAHGAVVVGVLLARSRDRCLQASQATSAGRAGCKPRVSVVVAAMNEERDLPQLLAALDEQTWPELEVVLVNDRSTDATRSPVRCTILLRRYRHPQQSKLKMPLSPTNPVW